MAFCICEQDDGVGFQMEENLLAKEHGDYFMEKVMDIITQVKEDPDEALNTARLQAAAAAAAAATTTVSGIETPLTSPTTARKKTLSTSISTKPEDSEGKVIQQVFSPAI